MKFVSVRDLRGKSALIWKQLLSEKEIVITSKGRPIAVLSSISGENLEESIAAIRTARAIQAVEAMQLQSVKSGQDRMTLEEINTEIRKTRRERSK